MIKLSQVIRSYTMVIKMQTPINLDSLFWIQSIIRFIWT